MSTYCTVMCKHSELPIIIALTRKYIYEYYYCFRFPVRYILSLADLYSTNYDETSNAATAILEIVFFFD